MVDYSTDKSVIVLDCCASTTVTGSLLNCTDVEVKKTKIQTAKDREGMTATHSYKKKYFVINRLGYIISITTPAIYVRNLPQDLMGGKPVNRENIRVIFDEDQDICGLYPLNDKHEATFQNSIQQIYNSVQTMHWTKFKRMIYGIDAWDIRRISLSNYQLQSLVVGRKTGLLAGLRGRPPTR
jgi:hypothetical protein